MKNSYGLVIGIADYDHVPSLPPTVLKDAQDIHDLLIDPSYCGYPPANVQLLLNHAATRLKIGEAFDKLALQCDEDSIVLIYVSGHGGRVETGPWQGEYLIAVDTESPTDQRLAETAISGAEFSNALSKIRARKIVVIFDCCHAAGLARIKSPTGTGFKAGLPEAYYLSLAVGRGRVIIASSRDSEFSSIMPGHANSLFTVHLLAGLRGAVTGPDGLIRIFDLFSYLQPKVTAEQPNQHPIFKVEVEENFPIALSLGGLPMGSAAPQSDPGFVGREDLIKSIAEAVKAKTLIVLCGITGIGKTSLLAELSNQLLPRSIFWYEFKPGLTSLDDLLIHLARFLDAETGKTFVAAAIQQPSLTIPEKLQVVLQVLNGQPFYLVFDAIHVVDDSPEFISFFSILKDQLNQGSVLFASRSIPKFYTPLDVVKGRVKVVELEGLNAVESSEFFAAKGINPSAELIDSLSARFGGLPLALELVAALLADEMSESEIRAKLNEAASLTVEYLFQEVFERLEDKERDLLTLAALFVFSFSQEELLNVYRGLLHANGGSDSFKKLNRQFLIKKVRTDQFTLHEAVKTMALANTDLDIPKLRRQVADHLLQTSPEDFGAHLESALLYCNAAEYDTAAKEIVYLVEWSTPSFPEIAQALLSRLDASLVSPGERVWLIGAAGSLAHHMRRTIEAENYFQQMLKLAESISNQTAIAIALQRLGIIYYDKDRERCEEFYLNSLAIKKELGDLSGQAEIYNNLGSLYTATQRFAEADEVLRKGLKLREEIKSPPREIVSIYGNLGILHALQKNWEIANSFSAKALEMAIAAESMEEMARATYNLAKHADEQGKREEARNGYMDALNAAQKYHLWETEELARTALAMQNYVDEKYDAAVDHLLRVAEIQEQIGDKARLAVTYFDLGTFRMKANQFPEALEFYENGTALFEHLSSEEKIEVFLKNIYVVSAKSAEPRRMLQALKFLKRRLSSLPPAYALAMVYGTLGKIYLELLARERVGYGCLRKEIVLLGDLGRYKDQIQSLGGLATTYEKAERHGDAIETLNNVIDVAEKQQLTHTVAWAFYNRGNLYAHLENLPEAETNFRQAITIAEEHDQLEVAASALHNLAEVMRRQDRIDEAIPKLSSAVQSAQQRGDVSDAITALNNLGLAYESIARDEEALASFNSALELSRQHYRKREEANTLISFGNFYLEREDAQRAQKYYEQSLDAARDAEDTVMEEASMLSLAYAHRQLGTFAEIVDDFKVVAERAATLKHYEHLILFLTLAGEIDFDKGDIEGAIKMFEQATMLALTVPIKRFGQLRYDILELMSTSMLPKVVAKILVGADRAIREGRIGDVETFCRGLCETLREERWGSLGILLIDNPIRKIELYLKERPDQDLLGYVFGTTDGDD